MWRWCFIGKAADKEEIPIVSVVGITGTALVTVNSFADLKIVAKALKKPIMKLARFGDTQRFFVSDKNTRYAVEVKIEGATQEGSSITFA